MSPSSPDLLQLGVTGYRFTRGGESRQTDWPARLAPPAASSLIEALASLKLPTAARRSKLAIELDDAWLRYQLIRMPAALRKPAERAAYVAAMFREVFGIECGPQAPWQVACEPAAFGEPQLAMAMESSLLQALQQLPERSGHTLASLSGSFIATYNRHRLQMPATHGALALASHGRICLGLWHAGRWQALRSQPLAKNANALGALLAQLLAASPATPESPSGTLYLAGQLAHAQGLPSAWQTVRLEGAA